jgi:hypothetical protein
MNNIGLGSLVCCCYTNYFKEIYSRCNRLLMKQTCDITLEFGISIRKFRTNSPLFTLHNPEFSHYTVAMSNSPLCVAKLAIGCLFCARYIKEDQWAWH